MKRYENILLIFFIIILFIHHEQQNTGIQIMSKINQKKYIVQERHDNQKASDILAQIQYNIITLFNHLDNKYPNNKDVKRLLHRFNTKNIVEGTLDSEFTTYTLNKGDKIVFCLRSKQNQNRPLHDINTIMYVAIHELSHIMSISYHHTTEFQKHFKFLLKEAQQCNVYKYVDYSNNPKEYCGIIIS